MRKKTKFSQLAILSAGTFANVLTAILFFVILIGFSSLAFAPAGVIFNGYANDQIPVAGISAINNITLTNASYQQLLNNANEEGFNELKYQGRSYLVTKGILERQEGNSSIIVYHSAPAIKNNLSSIITEINGVKTNSIQKLVAELEKYSPNEEITVKTITENGSTEIRLVLEEHPGRQGTAWLGIAFISQQRTGLLAGIINSFSFREPNVYYEPKFDGISVFVYNLIWWVVIISISVALINMLPVGIFDGGRFFYLTILGLTKNEKLAGKLFVFSTRFFLFLLLLLLVLWAISFLR